MNPFFVFKGPPTLDSIKHNKEHLFGEILKFSWQRFWDDETRKLLEAGRRFTDIYCFHRQDDKQAANLKSFRKHKYLKNLTICTTLSLNS
jgi:hypothetical protein